MLRDHGSTGVSFVALCSEFRIRFTSNAQKLLRHQHTILSVHQVYYIIPISDTAHGLTTMFLHLSCLLRIVFLNRFLLTCFS